jgi:phage shock protein A
MAPEVEKWAAGLIARVSNAWRSSPAPNASRQALGKIGFWVARPGLDAAYQQHLVALTRVRRTVADVATSRVRLELQIGELERQADEPRDPSSKTSDAGQGGTIGQSQTARRVTEHLADLRRRYADIQAKEERVTAASRRLMAEINAFRASKEATKASYTAAEEAAEAVWAEASR